VIPKDLNSELNYVLKNRPLFYHFIETLKIKHPKWLKKGKDAFYEMY
jgi:hypothetical protein